MKAATIIVPTHNHGEALRLSIGSALNQTLTDFELLIVGDGCDEPTRAVAYELATSDPRVRFLDYPKGLRKGEAHRHTALENARGRFVAYLGDDDLWLPHHLETLDQLLRDADFGHTLHAGLSEAPALFFLSSDLENPALRHLMLTADHNRFDLTFGAHTLEAYRRLPVGWESVSAETRWADLHLWRLFLQEPWCRAVTAHIPTGLCTHSHLRPHLTPADRARELAAWRTRMEAPDFRSWFEREALAAISRHAIGEMMGAQRVREA
jgi:GalNAc5-diNAcBac-PP-undecaprenol beta-1,3-glucosyltransferase